MTGPVITEAVLCGDGLPSTRATAKLLGFARYFTGKPCKSGHIAPRRTTDKGCIVCFKWHIYRWRVKNAARVNEQNCARYAASLDEMRKHKREGKQARRKSNPEQARKYDKTNNRARYARKKGAVGNYTEADVQRIRDLQQDKCAFCRIELLAEGTIDHIEALSKGGNNYPRNIQLLCLPCNASKGNRDQIDYMRSLGRLL